MEPSYKRGPWDHENYLVIQVLGLLLCRGEKTNLKELGPAKLPLLNSDKPTFVCGIQEAAYVISLYNFLTQQFVFRLLDRIV